MSDFAKKIQKIIISNPKRAIAFMTGMSEDYWIKEGRKKAIDNFNAAANSVPAYKDFLKQSNKANIKLESFSDFEDKVPIIDKKSYLSKYRIDQVCKTDVAKNLTMVSSSGSTGEPLYFMLPREDLELMPAGVAAFFDYFWDLCDPNKKVLIVFSLALGMWMGGTTGIFIYKALCDRYKNMSFVIPGTDAEKVVDVLEKIGGYYDFINIVTYPSFFKTVLDIGDARNINWKKHNITLTTAGEILDNGLSDYFISKMGNGLFRIFDGYGGTEIGNPGMATPMAMKIKELSRKNPALSAEIFGNKEYYGSIFQVNLVNSWVEQVNGEIIITKGGTNPVIRYNSHDLGNIISYSDMLELLNKYKIDIKKELEKENWHKPLLKWPFITITGRNDSSISIFGAKIAPSGLQPIFSRDERIRSFKLGNKEPGQIDHRYVALVELQPSVNLLEEEKKSLEKYLHDEIKSYLLETNFDYVDAYKIHHKKADPKIIFYNYSQGPFDGEINKKPKNIL